MKTNNIKPNYSELARLHSCDRRTVKKYDNGYEGKPTTRDKESKLDKYKEKIKSKLEKIKENIIFVGSPGVGKTHLATAIGIIAAQNRNSTYFINCNDLIVNLKKCNFARIYRNFHDFMVKL